MKRTSLGIAFLGLFLSPLMAADSPYQVVNGPKDFYYGHISLVEAKAESESPVILRGDARVPEPAVLNAPIGPGDTIRTSPSRRVEIQFDNGTIIRMDTDSELRIETILARALSADSRMSNLVLSRGRLFVMYKQYSAREIFQIVLPKAAVKLRHNSVAMIGLNGDNDADVQVKYGKADILFGQTADKLDKRVVGKGMRAIVGSDYRFAFQAVAENSDFETWNKTINDDFQELHKGLSTLPKPVRRLNPAVQSFAEKFGNFYGTWIYDDYLGYVWRPNYNDTYPNGSWQPYFYGQWISSAGQMYWVPGEPWGWVPYHLGIWQWDAKKGWFWIPGSAFAPAWVDWAIFQGHSFAWRPWSIWDWAWDDPFAYKYGWAAFFAGNNNYWRWPGYWNLGWNGSPYCAYWADYFWWGNPFIYGFPYWWGYDQAPLSGWIGGEAPNKRDIGGGTIHRPGVDGAAGMAMPAEMAGIYKKLMAGLQKGDPALLASLKKQNEAAVVVEAADLGSPRVNEKAAPIKSYFEALARGRSEDALKTLANASVVDALQARLQAARAVEQDMDTRPSGGADTAWSKFASDGRVLDAVVMKMLPAPAPRIRDWNPDVAFLRDRGLSLSYNPRANQVVCPELRMTSSMAEAGYRIVPSRGRAGGDGAGAFRDGSSRLAGSTNESGATSGYMVSPSGSSASASSASASASTSSSGLGGHIK